MIKDKDMIYNEKKKRYILTKDYVQNELGIDLLSIANDEFDTNPTTLPDRILKYTSDMIYDYMKLNCADYKYACELIETNEEIHELFKDALYHQLVYFIQSGDLAISSEGDMSKSISQRTMQILLGNELLTSQRKIKMSRSSLYSIFFDGFGGGGIY